MSKVDNRTQLEVSQIGMFIIDVLRHDVEAIPSILKLLNNDGCIGWRFAWSHDFTQVEVKEALDELLQKQLLLPLYEDAALKALVPFKENSNIWAVGIENIWFDITHQGWEMWHKWEPPMEEI